MAKPFENVIKITISILTTIGSVRVWYLTREAILHHYSWCGTDHAIRFNKLLPYAVLLAPTALVAVIATWRKISKIDYFTKVTCLTFLSTLVLYWFFNNYTDIFF